MTPSTWMAENIAMFGFAWIFGSVLLLIPVGVLIGRFRGAEAGAGSGLLMWGAGNLLVCALMASYTYLDTVVVQAAATRCEPGTDGSGQPTRQFHFAFQRTGEPAHELQLKAEPGLCPESPEPSVALRARRDALASSTAIVPVEAEPSDLPLVIMVAWGAFGGMAVLIGLLIAGARAMGRPGQGVRSTGRSAAQETPAWRQRLGLLFSQLGGLLFLAAFIAPWFIDGGENRALQLGFRCVAAAMGCWLLASWLAGTATWTTALFMLMFGGIFLGVAELARIGT